MRRGKPSTHIKFGESTAVLAGNSLLTLAFEIITDKKYKVKHATKVILLKKLAECAGHTGIAGGQFLDLSYEKRKIGASKIINMQKKKTGKLFEFCCLAPSIVSASLKVFDILSSTTTLRDKLEENTAYFRDKMTSAGFDIKESIKQYLSSSYTIIDCGTDSIESVDYPKFGHLVAKAVSDKDVTWKEGTRDRRTSGFTSNGGGGSLAVKYADYIIHSNIIMLCQGRDKDQSLERCESIINAVTEGTRS